MAPFTPRREVSRTMGETPQTPLPTNLPAVLGGPLVVRAQVSYRYLTFPVVFSVVLANSRISIAGSSCATLRLRLPAIWVGRRRPPSLFHS